MGGDLYNDEVRAAVRDLAGGGLQGGSQGERGRVLHVNNLENPRDAGTARADTLFRSLRDLLLIPGAHWRLCHVAGALVASGAPAPSCPARA